MLPDGGKVRYIYSGGSLDTVILYASGGSVTCYLKYLYNASGELEYILRKKDNFSDSSRYELFAVVYNGKGEITRLVQTRKQTSTGVGFQFRVVANYTYDAYGSVTVSSPISGEDLGVVNPLRYKNYIYDTETDWYYLQTRYYDPEICRFISADGQLNGGALGNNLFAYCGNNPVVLQDMDGNIPFFAVTAVIGAVAGAVIGGIKAAKSGKNVWAGMGIGAAVGGLAGFGLGAIGSAALAGNVAATTGQVITGGTLLVSTVSAGGVGAGIGHVSSNLRQAGEQLTNTVATSIPKAFQKTPQKLGDPFIPGKTGIQTGVDPTTLTPTKDLSTLNPYRIAQAVKYGMDQTIRVGNTGRILDGHHRVADAIQNGRLVDVFVEPFK